jgi:hypothetical protein
LATRNAELFDVAGAAETSKRDIYRKIFRFYEPICDQTHDLSLTGFVAAQGNFRGGIFGFRLLGSSNPNAWNYLGEHMQSGVFDATTNTWISPQTGTTSNFLGGHYSGQYRDFNFLSWNH